MLRLMSGYNAVVWVLGGDLECGVSAKGARSQGRTA